MLSMLTQVLMLAPDWNPAKIFYPAALMASAYQSDRRCETERGMYGLRDYGIIHYAISSFRLVQN